VFLIAFFFLLRVYSGCVVIAVKPSSWIMVTTFFLSLTLGFIKRRSEMVMLSEDAVGHRKVLSSYSLELLDQFVLVCVTLSISSYTLYCMNPEVIAMMNFEYLYVSVVFVTAGLFRFMQISKLALHGAEGDPSTLLLKDTFLQITVVFWFVFFLGILHLR
jgi:hypothetical protein